MRLRADILLIHLVLIHAPRAGRDRHFNLLLLVSCVSIHAHMAQISATQKQREGARYAVPHFLCSFIQSSHDGGSLRVPAR